MAADAAASASTAPPPGEMPTPAPSTSGPPAPDPIPSTARPRGRREVASRYLSAPTTRRLSTSSSHPSTPSTRAHHDRPPASATTPLIFGLADENHPPTSAESRKRAAAAGLLDGMHHPRPISRPPTPLAAAAATASASRRGVLHPSRASPNVATPAHQHRRGGVRPCTPARTSYTFPRASSETSVALAETMEFCTPASCPRRTPCSLLRSSLPSTQGIQRPANLFCFEAGALPKALVKPPQPVAQKVLVDRKLALMGGKKAVGKQEDVHQLRLLNNCLMQYRFLNARAEAVAMAKNAAAEKSFCGLSERIADLQVSVADKNAQLECLKRVEKVDSVVGAQVLALEEWTELEREYARGTTALRDALSHMPIIGKVNVREMQGVLSSATKILEQLSLCAEHVSGKVEEIQNVGSNLDKLIGSEKMLLEECAALLHQALDIQVMEQSLRIQLMSKT